MTAARDGRAEPIDRPRCPSASRSTRCSACRGAPRTKRCGARTSGNGTSITEGSLPLTSLVWGAELSREQARIEEAHDTLLDPVRRRAYDLSTFPEEALSEAPAKGRAPAGMASELLMLQAELAREIHAETQFTGALLQKVRESQGVEIADIAAKTKIAATHLRAIEQEAFNQLPALVYTRGFVQELAKCLRLDPSQVARTYLKRMRETLAASER